MSEDWTIPEESDPAGDVLCLLGQERDGREMICEVIDTEDTLKTLQAMKDWISEAEYNPIEDIRRLMEMAKAEYADQSSPSPVHPLVPPGQLDPNPERPYMGRKGLADMDLVKRLKR